MADSPLGNDVSLPDDWSVRPLEELLENKGLAIGVMYPGAHEPTGVPIIRVKNMRGGRIVTDDVLRVNTEVEAMHPGARLHGGEVLLSLVGSVGRVAIVPNELAGWNTARAVAVLRVGNQVSNRWIKLWLESSAAQAHIESRLNTTVQSTLNLRDVRKVPVVIPPKKDRSAITDIASALDDKIAVNERIATAAEALSAATYEESHSQSPGDFSERPLTYSAQFINGRAFTKNSTGTGRMVIRIAEVNSGPGTSTVYNDLEVPDKHLARPGDILFAWSGSLTVARWYRAEGIINQHIFKVVPNEGIPTWLAFQLVNLKLEDFRTIAADKATTMGHIQRRHLEETVPTPNPHMLEKLDSELRPLWERALAAEQESLALAALRDTLLPQLMSGKLRVRDAERIVEDAV
jgi:type I restriction enzyme S subunit